MGKQSAFSVTTDLSPANIYRLESESEDTAVVTVGEFGVLTAVGPGETRVRAFTTVYDEDDQEVVIEAITNVVVTEESPEPEPDPEPQPEPESEPGPEPEPEPSPEPEEVIYTISSDSKGEWKRGNKDGITYIIKRSVDDETCFSHFTGVEIDGKALKAGEEYTAAPGSTVIEIKTETLDGLSLGEHSITVRYDDGEVKGSLKITEEKADGDELPETGDDSKPYLWIGILILSLICLGTLIFISVRNKKKKDSE